MCCWLPLPIRSDEAVSRRVNFTSCHGGWIYQPKPVDSLQPREVFSSKLEGLQQIFRNVLAWNVLVAVAELAENYRFIPISITLHDLVNRQILAYLYKRYHMYGIYACRAGLLREQPQTRYVGIVFKRFMNFIMS